MALNHGQKLVSTHNIYWKHCLYLWWADVKRLALQSIDYRQVKCVNLKKLKHLTAANQCFVVLMATSAGYVAKLSAATY